MELVFKISPICHFELAVAGSLKMMYGRAFGFEFATEPCSYRPYGGGLWEVLRRDQNTQQLFLKFGGISLTWNRADVFKGR